MVAIPDEHEQKCDCPVCQGLVQVLELKAIALPMGICLTEVECLPPAPENPADAHPLVLAGVTTVAALKMAMAGTHQHLALAEFLVAHGFLSDPDENENEGVEYAENENEG